MTDTVGMWIFCLMGMGIMLFIKPILGAMVALGQYLEGM